MKKLLLSTAAVCGLAVAATAPASASELELGISGFFAGYGVYVNQDEDNGSSLRSFDLRKETELHFTGETTLDNGLTVGVVVQTNMDRADNADTIEESYAYLSGGWGRLNIGEEDGAAYLLQVAAPSADENIDGVRQQIDAFNVEQLVNDTFAVGVTKSMIELDYDHDGFGYMNKLTYFTPVFNGFQAGVSYIPGIDAGLDKGALDGITSDSNATEWDDAYQVAMRYEGSFEELDVALGAGYTRGNWEVNAANSDDYEEWNVGVDFDWGPFGLGFAYVEDNNGAKRGGDEQTFVVGVDYVTGPYRFGASYMGKEVEQGAMNALFAGTPGETEVDRWTGGVTYEYGPGMSFRGSISYVDVETASQAHQDRSGYQFVVGTQVNF